MPSSIPTRVARFISPSDGRATGGYGIGLSIAKAVVNAHKGKIIAAKDGDRLVLTATLPLTQ